jgi:hypothetical protein
MSFQFFSKLDNKITDGPASQLDRNKSMQSIIRDDGQMGKDIRRTIQDEKRQTRLARRAYRAALRSNDPNQMMAVSGFLQGREDRNLSGINRNPTRDITIAENEFLSRGGNLGAAPRRQEEFNSALENRSSEFGSGLLSGQNSPENPDTYSPSADPSVPVKNVSFAQRQREAFRSDLHKSDLLRPETPLADREMAKARAYKRADSLGIDRAKVDAEMGWDKERDRAEAEAGILESESQFEKGLLESKRSAAEEGMKDSERRAEYGLDDALEKHERMKSDGFEALQRGRYEDNLRDTERQARMAEIEKGESERVAKYGNPGTSLENRGTEGALAKREIDERSAKKKEVAALQTKVTDDYFAAAELESPTSNLELGRTNFFGAFNVASAYNDTLQGQHSPFIPHGVFSGETKKEFASDPKKFKQAIDSGKAFNEALGGKDVKMKYKERNGRKIMSPHGDKHEVFSSDAFTPLKKQAIFEGNLKNPSPDPSRTATHKIIQAAVDNNYPIDLDEELMAIPQFVEQLHTARVKKSMTVNEKGFTIWKDNDAYGY